MTSIPTCLTLSWTDTKDMTFIKIIKREIENANGLLSYDSSLVLNLLLYISFPPHI
jgi:hypothetical protein